MSKTDIKRIDFTGQFLSLDGTPMFYVDTEGKNIDVDDINIYIAKALGNLKTKDALRTMILAKKIYENKAIDLDKSDLAYLKEHIKEINISDIMMYQILDKLE